VMVKDRGWVSRSVKEIKNALGKPFSTPDEAMLIAESELRSKELFAASMKLVKKASSDSACLRAIRQAASVARQAADFQVAVGIVQKAPHTMCFAGMIGAVPPQPSYEYPQGEVDREELDKRLLAMADAFREQQRLEALNASSVV